MNINDSRNNDKMKVSSARYELQLIYIRMAELLKAKHTNTHVSKQYIKFLPT